MDGEGGNRLYTTIGHHLFCGWSMIFFLLTYLLVLVWYDFNLVVLVAYGIGIALIVLPAIYLHLEYWLENKDQEYEIRTNELIRYLGEKREVFKSEDIEEIKIYLSPAMHRGGIQVHFLSIEAYHYARVTLVSGEELIITCLLSRALEASLRQLKGVKIVRKKRLFNTLHWK